MGLFTISDRSKETRHSEASSAFTKDSLKDSTVISLERDSLDKILEVAIEKGASDIYLADAERVYYKINGRFYFTDKCLADSAVNEFFAHDLEQAKEAEMLKPRDQRSHKILQYDFRYEYSERYSFRVNYYLAHGRAKAVLRVCEKKWVPLRELHVLENFEEVTRCIDGLVLVVGMTGSGKTTTLSSILNEVAKNRPGHYITLEDPIELYIEPREGIIVSQRELGKDVRNYEDGLVAAMRQAGTVILIGEIRNFNTLKYACQLASTGHVVFTTLHASNCIEALIRSISMIPESEQFVKTALVYSLRYILAQRLLKTADGRLVPACEFLPITQEIRPLLLDNRIAEIKSLFESYGGVPYWRHLKQQIAKFNIKREDQEFTIQSSSVLEI